MANLCEVRVILCVIQSPAKGYDADTINGKLQAAENWARFANGTWLIVTSRSPAEWRDELQPYVGSGSLLVIQVQRNWAGFTNEITDWLKKSNGEF